MPIVPILELEKRLDFLLEGGLGNEAHAAVHFLAVLQEDNGGDVPHAKSHGQVFVLLHVAFADDDPSVEVLCQFLDDGCQTLARATPCCPLR